jgi:hypothetical protein
MPHQSFVLFCNNVFTGLGDITHSILDSGVPRRPTECRHLPDGDEHLGGLPSLFEQISVFHFPLHPSVSTNSFMLMIPVWLEVLLLLASIFWTWCSDGLNGHICKQKYPSVILWLPQERR